MTVKEMFDQLVSKIKEDPSHIQGLNIVYQFNISGDDEGIYQLKLEDGTVEYLEGETLEAKTTLELSDKNFLKLAEGNLNPTTAYMTGKLKVRGDLSQALKLNSLLKEYQS
ncbi:SCP2 sterol-binding domain-containing protein [Bacillus shivajii]|uniref:SCP2 sterol-binding domain-containing protein n=1 Tax=Bacillus shivajii TaxID=1983719 RepID=UPI001CFBD5D5|nr:SCP2 sterol-binding domain-containing protein [Bacillus shivajii]UCZ54055.1 SCP2 sterol-binding domain-containing protein [Bacillus shivajii]